MGAWVKRAILVAASCGLAAAAGAHQQAPAAPAPGAPATKASGVPVPPAPPEPPRPSPVQPDAHVHRIVAIGDLHGDDVAWRAVAKAAGLIDAAGHWAGGKTVFVQTGDVTDRGPDTLHIVDDLMRLQREAPRVGGQVITLVGNHEAMNVTDDLRYVAPQDYAAFADAGSSDLRDRVWQNNRDQIGAEYRERDPNATEAAIKQAWYAATPPGKIEHQRAWHPDGRIGRWVTSNPAVAMIDGTLFVHGGISRQYAKMSVQDINRKADAALLKRDTNPSAIINDQNGPLWYRGLIPHRIGGNKTDAAPATQTGATNAMDVQDELDDVLKAYHAQRMVIGHTPILSGIQILFDGKLVRIDTGMTSYYHGALSYLEILDGTTLVPHEVEQPPTP